MYECTYHVLYVCIVYIVCMYCMYYMYVLYVCIVLLYVCAKSVPPPHFLLREGELSLLLSFQKGGLDRTLIFKGGLVGKRGVTFLRGGAIFT